MLKEKLIAFIISGLKKKLEELNATISSLLESRDNETKSTAGDKYETGREMLQQEISKHRAQLTKTEKLLFDISRIDPKLKMNSVNFGSLVYTNQNSYFISIGLGKVSIENKDFFCVSLASPIGKLLKSKKVGDKFFLQNNKIEIQGIE